MVAKRKACLVTGSACPDLAKKIASILGIDLFPLEVAHFTDGECRVHLPEGVAGRPVFCIESLGRRPNDWLIETMLIADALRRAGASRIVLACPYLAYSRQNLPESDGASLAARLFAYFLHEAGVSELIAMDLHAEHIPSFYDFPVEHLSARKSLSNAMKKAFPEVRPVICGPDLGSAKLVASYAEEFGTSFALIQKRRLDPQRVESLSLVGEVKGKDVLLADDMCSTAGTLVSAAKVCREKGAKRIFAAVTHGIFVGKSMEAIAKSPIEKLFVTDTIAPDDKIKSFSKICPVSIAPIFAEALKRAIARFSI